MSKKPAVPPRLQIADNMKRGAPTAREAEAAATRNAPKAVQAGNKTPPAGKAAKP